MTQKKLLLRTIRCTGIRMFTLEWDAEDLVRLERTREVLGEAGSFMDSHIRALLTQGALRAWGGGRVRKCALFWCSLPVPFCFLLFCFSLLPGPLLQPCSGRSSGQEAFKPDLPVCVYWSQRYGPRCQSWPGSVHSRCLLGKNYPEPWNKLGPNDRHKFHSVNVEYSKLSKEGPDFCKTA